MTASYLTPLSAVVVPRAVKLGSIWVTRTALLDPDGPGLAHLTPAGVAEIARRVGGRLLTAAEVHLLHEVASAAGTELEAFTLPTAAMRREGCVPGDPRMGSREWCEVHDREVLRRIAALDGVADDCPIANDGKPWTDPLGSLCGWWVERVELYVDTTKPNHRRGPGFVQEGGHVVHAPGRVVDGVELDDGQHDYGTTGRIAWDEDPGTW